MVNSNSPLMDKCQDVRQNLSELGSLAADAAREQAARVTDAAKQRAAQLRDSAGELYEQGCNKAKGAQNQAEDYIRREPLKTVLIAGAAGFVAGWLFSRCGSNNRD